VRSVFLCYSLADAALAEELAEFLRRGARVEILQAEGALEEGTDLLAKARAGWMADVELVVLSPDSAPARWRREQWMPVLWEEPQQAGVAVGILLARDCHLPELLRRTNFFDLRADRQAGFRAVKQWLLGLDAAFERPAFLRPRGFAGREGELEWLRRRLGDEPGCAIVKGCASGSGKTALALAFLAEAAGDFEAVCWVDCGGRSPAGAAGDMAAQLGLRLAGPEEEDCARLRRFCAERRILAVLDDLERESHLQLVAGGWSSALITTRCRELKAPGAAELELPAAFAAPHPSGPGPTERRLLAAMAACAPGCTLEFAAAVAGLAPAEARRAADMLLECGAVLMVESDRACFTMAAGVREAARDPEAARRQAEQAGRSLTAGLGQLERALEWALGGPGEESWRLACSLARQGFRQAQSAGRPAEAYRFLRAVYKEARRRGDARAAGECARELFWMAQDWGREAEARRYHWQSRTASGDQLVLPLWSEEGGGASGILD